VSVNEDRVCPHCYFMSAMGVSHKLTCHCTHHHADHNFAGGCKIKGCTCEKYDQTVHAAKIAVPKIKIAPKVETVDLEALIAAAEKQGPSDLIATQARIDKLKARIAEKENSMTHS
jgi:hypothetical protein